MNIKVQLLILLLLFCSLGPSTLRGEEIDKELSVYSRQRVNGPFLVDEKKLRRLNEVVKKRISEVCNQYQITYSVFFNDNSSYETKSFEVIFLEENSKNQKILGIKIKGTAKEDPCEDELNFSRSFYGPSISVSLSSNIWPAETMEFDIDGKDRDWVSLSSSDLNERLENMVLRYTLGEKLTSILIIILLLLLSGSILLRKMWYSWERYMKKKDPNYEGISFAGFLKEVGVIVGLGLLVPGLILVIIIYWYLSDYLKENYFPSTVFYFGEQIAEYQMMETYRDNWFWGIMAAGLLSIMITLYFKFLGKSE